MANLLLRHLQRLPGWRVEGGPNKASPAAGIGAPAAMPSRARVLTEGELAPVLWCGRQ